MEELEDEEETLKSELASLKDKPELRIDEKPEYEGLFNDFEEKQSRVKEGRHTFKDYEGYLVLYDQEERDKVIEFINEHNADFMNGQVDEALPYEEEYIAESDEETEEFKRTVEIKGATDTFIEDFSENLVDELQKALDVSVEDYDLDFTGYEYY